MAHASENIDYIIVERDIHAYVDGELSAERHALVDAYLAARPEMQRRVESYRMQNAGMQILFRHSGADRMRARIGPVRRARAPRFRQLKRAGAIVVVATAMVVVLGHFLVTGQPAARMAASNDIGDATAFENWANIVRVNDAQRTALATAFRRTESQASASVPAELEIPGCERVGSSASGGGTASGERFVYRSQTGEVLDLFVARSGARHGDTAGRMSYTYVLGNKRSMLYWEDGGLAFMLDGSFERQRFVSIGNDVMYLTRGVRRDAGAAPLTAANDGAPAPLRPAAAAIGDGDRPNAAPKGAEGRGARQLPVAPSVDRQKGASGTGDPLPPGCGKQGASGNAVCNASGA